MSDLGKYQNKITELPNINNLRYENIFKLYKLENNQYFYNLLRNIVVPDDIDEEKLVYYPVSKKLPWTMISFNIYGNIELWWLICLVNKVDNPVLTPDIGTVIKAISPEYLKTVIAEIFSSLP